LRAAFQILILITILCFICIKPGYNAVYPYRKREASMALEKGINKLVQELIAAGHLLLVARILMTGERVTLPVRCLPERKKPVYR